MQQNQAIYNLRKFFFKYSINIEIVVTLLYLIFSNINTLTCLTLQWKKLPLAKSEQRTNSANMFV